MSDDGKTILIGDENEARAQMLCEVMEDHFGRYVLVVSDFAALSAAVKERERNNNSWRLVLVATGLPLRPMSKDEVMPDHVLGLTVVDAAIRIGCIYSTTGRPNWEHIPNLHYLPVPPTALTESQRELIIQLLENGGRLKRELPAPTIRLTDDPILREQVRALDPERNFKNGEKALCYLIRNLKLGCEDVLVSKLGQGKSGAQVFHFATRLSNGEERDYVLKLAPKIDRWKLHLEISRHGQAKKAIGAYKIHVAELVEIDSSKIEGNPARHIVEYGNWNAICYDFLGGERFGPFMDLASAIVIAPERLQAKTKDTHQQFNQDSDLKLRVKLLETKLDWLKDTWYLKAKREHRVLWDATDRAAKGYPQMPPYKLPGQAKGNILNFLADRDAEIGRHFFDDWDARVQLVRQFLEWSANKPITGLLGRELQVVVSPVHGDLNANNILLWLKEARPFLIDLPWYQDAGHAVQDLASLEFNLKFYLLDRQELSRPKHPLPALDHSPTQLPLWRELEKRLLADAELGEAKNWQPKRCHSDNATLCWELLRYIRKAAVEVQAKPCGVANPPNFLEEYLPALLFYTVRAIGYDLPLPKRLLAIYSTSEILRKLQFV